MKSKIAVSVPSELAAHARRQVGAGRASSVSAYVSEALAEHAKQDRLLEMLDALDKQLGPPSRRDVRWARRVLGLSSSTPARSSR